MALEQLLVASNGEIYYDSGSQSLNLPHTFGASGRLEFGWHVDHPLVLDIASEAGGV